MRFLSWYLLFGLQRIWSHSRIIKHLHPQENNHSEKRWTAVGSLGLEPRIASQSPFLLNSNQQWTSSWQPYGQSTTRNIQNCKTWQKTKGLVISLVPKRKRSPRWQYSMNQMNQILEKKNAAIFPNHASLRLKQLKHVKGESTQKPSMPHYALSCSYRRNLMICQTLHTGRNYAVIYNPLEKTAEASNNLTTYFRLVKKVPKNGIFSPANLILVHHPKNTFPLFIPMSWTIFGRAELISSGIHPSKCPGTAESDAQEHCAVSKACVFFPGRWWIYIPED